MASCNQGVEVRACLHGYGTIRLKLSPHTKHLHDLQTKLMNMTLFIVVHMPGLYAALCKPHYSIQTPDEFITEVQKTKTTEHLHKVCKM